MLKENFTRIQDEVNQALRKSERLNNDLRILAVSKRQSEVKIIQAYDLGQRDFGENYVQEFLEKQINLESKKLNEIRWHFIGSLQSKKIKQILPSTELIHSVDRVSLVEEIQKRAESIGKLQKILIQVNISDEPTKSGIKISEGPGFLKSIGNFKNISIEGLMTMPPLSEDPEQARPYFRRLKELSVEWQKVLGDHHQLRELSMGTSGDFGVAIEEGATIIRIGSALLGERD